MKWAAVERSRLEGTTGGSVTVGHGRGRHLEKSRQERLIYTVTMVNFGFRNSTKYQHTVFSFGLCNPNLTKHAVLATNQTFFSNTLYK